ncbi:flagellar basal body rod protein FlgB [Allorhizobium sp. BGMRC 0089]|uniref:flagellar basal body rod protein FlgB n=1 Tax=Allorhizobium sonneratiae TaxID=2934936 RepID=UPI0020332D0E|nr:flagellar basal body rod protein FlgB [Allorhizobium sonneratiae]MCM2291403.1 flagellar basal body rod protein FlgB [Allorhizobium sonneratiae]
MEPIQLFDLASRQAEWLSLRQEVVAGNIANANTPKYKAKDITPFKAVLDHSQTVMARTNPADIASNDLNTNLDVDVRTAPLTDEVGVQVSGNSVSIADEMTKMGEIRQMSQLNTNLVSKFNSMMLMTVKR